MMYDMAQSHISDPQYFALMAISFGSNGDGASVHTVESLQRRGLISGMEGRVHGYRHGWRLDTTAEGEAVLQVERERRSSMKPKDAQDQRGPR